jgi:hypothetical protein
VFPVANKITNGIISSFCPLFSQHNIQRKLELSIVTTQLIRTALDEIRTVDFSAYYREVMFSAAEMGTAKETINVEVLPDIIIMPNIGTRGVMWQEIEGTKRTTPGRGFVPMFMQNDLKTMLIKMTGEFRWEMCKRVQGGRWNDVTDPSLTSEYYDYLLFYKRNRDLNADMKEAIKKELAQARNNYKTVFVNNYLNWITYESSGALRLSKFTRKMMMAYCTFPADIRKTLEQRPQFAEFIKKHDQKQQKRLQHLTHVIQNIKMKGFNVPQELLDEQVFTNR